ncbi:MAG: M20/M25/M40 family metallo-hydrolase [Chloroflexi bacterium]|nr:M20/M25/M40 family metallo-hydrolase [Chloroflexota bacterium]
MAAASLLVLAFLAPAGARAETEASETSLGERAMETVRYLSEEIGVRPAGSEADREAAQYLAEQFASMGYSVDVDPFRFRARSPGTTQNVVARYPSEDPRLPLVIVGAHYDSVPTGPGANDNASGTAAVIELARLLAADPIPGVAVRYVAFGAEELGLLGSQHLVDNLSLLDRARLRLMISMDMLSVGEQPAFHGSEPWLSHALARAWSQGWEPVVMPPNFARMSDHGPFLQAGLPGIFFYWTDDPCWHLACDVSSRVNPQAIELMDAIAAELIRIAAEP